MFQTLMFSLVFLAAMATSAAPAQKKFIENEVDRLVPLFSDGMAVEYHPYRHIKFGKIFASDKEDAIAIFSIEGFHGGNDHAEYLAFFQSVEQNQVPGQNPRPFRLVAVTQIGGRSWRSFDGDKIRLGSGFVALDGKKYGPNDAACCPSIPIQVTFRVAQGAISESK